MTARPSALRRPTPAALTLAVLVVLATPPALAQFKVVGPDGKVTYTDRPPADGKVTTLGARAPLVAEVAMPVELRQAMTRYPVSLYVTSGACEPCDAARQLLRSRGIPFAEKQVLTAEDSEALERLSGGRDAPTLAIGAQTLRGLAPDVWNSYLDSAGYPRESRLPANYQYPAATPLTERREATVRAAPRPAADASAPTAPAAPPAAPGGIKF